MFELIVVVFAIWIVHRVVKPYTISLKDTVIAFTGGLGSGKTFMSVKCAVRAYRGALFGWYLDRIFHPKKTKELPKPQL